MDSNGEMLWRVQLVVLGDGEADIVRVSVPGEPAVRQGEMVRVDGLTAQAWEMDGRSGMAFRAGSIRSASRARRRRRRRDGRTREERRRHEAVELVVGVLGALWRLRLEIGLAAVLISAQLGLSAIVDPLYASLLLVALAMGVLSAPLVRGWLFPALRAASIRRAWWRAWTDCELPRVRAGRVTSIPAGELLRVRASRGSSRWPRGAGPSRRVLPATPLPLGAPQCDLDVREQLEARVHESGCPRFRPGRALCDKSRAWACDGGHGILPTGGHRISPVAAMRSPH